MANRDKNVDVLRCLAITGIIIAHIQPSLLWFQLRNFDVPMMVVLSAVCFSMGGGVTDYWSYYCKRCKRLILPVWIFLTTSYLIRYLYNGYLPSLGSAFMNYSLLTPAYFWIIRVFFLMALLAPIISKFVNSSGRWFWLCLCVGLLVNEVLCNTSHAYFYEVVVMTFSYSIIYAFGIYLPTITNRRVLVAIGGGEIVIFLSIAAYLYISMGGIQTTQKWKYPPQLYYLSYALGVVTLLWAYREELASLIDRCHIMGFVTYIGSHTLWIYLWHIPFLMVVHGHFNAPIRFILIYSIAIILSYTQSILVKSLCDKCIKSEKVRKNLTMILVG